MGDDEPERGKPLEEVGAQQLHEGGGIGIDVVRAGEMEVWIAGIADMDHRRHIEFHQRLVEREPPGIGERRIGPVAAAGVRSEEHTSELQSLMRISYAVFCLKKNKNNNR